MPLIAWRHPRPRRAVCGRAAPCIRSAIRLAPLLMLSACNGGVLDPQGPIGRANALIMLNALEIMLVIAVPTMLAALFFAWWFRASNPKARYRPHFVYSGRLELIVWAIPLLVIMFLGGVIWIGSHDLDPFRPIRSHNQPLNVQVVALDWKWLFIYPHEGIAAVNQLVVPEGVPIHFYLTSASVMNVFFVPQLGSMIYAMNGMVSQLWLQADRPGDYFGLAAQFNGDGFPRMHFTVHAVPAAQFTTWVDGVRQGKGPDLTWANYLNLEKQSQNVAPYAYRTVDRALFLGIATQSIPPGPGPHAGPAGPQVRPVD